MSILSHVGHNHEMTNWFFFFGQFHLVILHFPIALFFMAGVAEFGKSLVFQHAARFMVSSGALLSVPTALLGLAYSTGTSYEEPFSSIFWWHQFCGISTACLAIIVAVLKEMQFRKRIKTIYYFVPLSILILFVGVTGFLGGTLSLAFCGCLNFSADSEGKNRWASESHLFSQAPSCNADNAL